MRVKIPDGCGDLGDYAFYGCSSLFDINCLNGQMTSSLANIGSHCFDGCNSLVDVKINLGRSNRLTMIGEYAFANCSHLRSAEWTQAPYIASHMFSGCSSLTSLSLYDSTNYVYPYGFAEIPNLISVRIPKSLWFLNDNMFEGCGKLSSVAIEDGNDSNTSSVMNQLGEWVFNKCSSLTEIPLPKSITSFSQIDPNFLAGSSISSVRFNGIDSSLFGNYSQVISTNYRTGRWYTYKKDTKTNPGSLVKFAMDKKIPVVVLVQGSEGNKAWDYFNDRVLKKYSPNPNYFYVRIAQSAKSKIENLVKTFGQKYINMT